MSVQETINLLYLFNFFQFINNTIKVTIINIDLYLLLSCLEYKNINILIYIQLKKEDLLAFPFLCKPACLAYYNKNYNNLIHPISRCTTFMVKIIAFIFNISSL